MEKQEILRVERVGGSDPSIGFISIRIRDRESGPFSCLLDPLIVDIDFDSDSTYSSTDASATNSHNHESNR